MRSIRVFQACVVFWLSISAASAQESFFERLGKLVGGAPEEAPTMPAADIAAPVQVIEGVMMSDQQDRPTDRDRDEFRRRAKAYSEAMNSWVSAVCQLSAEQQTTLAEATAAALAESEKSYSERSVPNLQQKPLSDSFPILFAGPEGVSSLVRASVLKALKSGILSPEQQQKLDVALKERDDYSQKLCRDFVVRLIDSNLFLTEEQLAAIDHALALENTVQHTLYSFNPQNYAMPYQQLADIIPARARKQVLTANQQARVSDLQRMQNNSVSFQSTAGEDEWERQIKTAGTDYVEATLHAAAVRIDWYRQRMSLNENQVRLLQLAARGAAMTLTDDWKELARGTVSSMMVNMRNGGNFWFSTQDLNVNSIDTNPIWKKTIVDLAKETGVDAGKLRESQAKELMLLELMTVLEGELWLLPEQREMVRKRMERTLPAALSGYSNADYFRTAMILMYPTTRLDFATMGDVLNPQQIAVMGELRSYFRANAQNGRANTIVEIQMKNQGSWQFVLE